jgi:hypothetical protein
MHACAKLDIGYEQFFPSLRKHFSLYRKVELVIKAGANVNSSIASGKTAYDDFSSLN